MEVGIMDKIQSIDIDTIIIKIKEGEVVICPKCGETLQYQASSDLRKIYCIYCEKCLFSAKMTYR